MQEQPDWRHAPRQPCGPPRTAQAVAAIAHQLERRKLARDRGVFVEGEAGPNDEAVRVVSRAAQADLDDERAARHAAVID